MSVPLKPALQRGGAHKFGRARLVLTAVALLSTPILTALSPTVAQAGSFDVQVCRNGYGNKALVAGDAGAQYDGLLRVTNNCDAGYNGWNGITVSVNDGPAATIPRQDDIRVAQNASGNIIATAAANTGIQKIHVDLGRMAAASGGSAGWQPRVMLIDSGWCRTDGMGGDWCGLGYQRPANDSGTMQWGDPNYPHFENTDIGPITGTASRVAIGVVCSGASGLNVAPNYLPCYRPPNTPAAGVSIVSAAIQVVDDSPPTIGGISGQVTDGQWHQPGALSYSVDGWDNTGIRTFQRFVDGSYVGDDDKSGSCDYSSMTPCPNSTDNGSVTISGDGAHSLIVRAMSASTYDLDCTYDCAATSTGNILIDGTPPGAPNSSTTTPGWTNSNNFSLPSSVPSTEDGNESPIVERRVTICPAGVTTGSSCSTTDAQPVAGGTVASAALSVPREGAWQAAVQLVDAAGNGGAQGNWVPLLLDQTPPSVSATQTRGGIAIKASDSLSTMVASTGAYMKYRADGAGDWQTVKGGDVTVPLPAGQHFVDVVAVDGAGNATGDTTKPQRFNVTVPDSSGNVPQLDTIGGDSQISVQDRGALNGSGASETATLTAWFDRDPHKKAPGKKEPARPPTNLTVRTISSKQGVTIEGQLINNSGSAIGNARIDVNAAIAGGITASNKGAATTDSNGHFVIALKAGQTSRKLAVSYDTRVNDSKPAAVSGLQLVVKAVASFTAHHPHVGGRTRFTGFVSSGYLTPQGVQVNLQWRHDGRWETFDSVRTNVVGRWKAYRKFTARYTYRMRAYVPSSPSYAYKGNASRARVVRVR